MKDFFVIFAELLLVVLIVPSKPKQPKDSKPHASPPMWAIEVKDEAGEACRRSVFFFGGNKHY